MEAQRRGNMLKNINKKLNIKMSSFGIQCLITRETVLNKSVVT
jgi:hypothetical protein